MVILRQEHIFKYNAKGKFVDCWMILTHELDGPTLALFKDQSAKKLVENRLVLCPLASRIRFGTTTLNVQIGSTPPPKFFPQIKASDGRVHGSCFILIQTERLVHKLRRPQFIWLCAKSTHQLFDIVRAISSCLVSMKVGAPLSNPMDDLNALHKYRPKPFESKNDWEAFWDNPPKITTDLKPASKADLMRSRGIAVSMDALNMMQMQEESNKLDRSKKNTKHPIYSSSPALETQDSLQQHPNNNYSQPLHATSSSRSSMNSRDSRMSLSRVYPNNNIFVVEEALPPIYELKKDYELIEKSRGSTAYINRLYEPKGRGSAIETLYFSPGEKSISKKRNRYTARRVTFTIQLKYTKIINLQDIALPNSNFDFKDTSSTILAYDNIMASEDKTDPFSECQASPHSILKNKPVTQAQNQHNPKYSSGSGYSSSSTPTRSTHTQTKKSSLKRRPSEMSVMESLAGANSPALPHGNVLPYIAIQNAYADAEVQTEHNKVGSPAIPLISIGNGCPINGFHPTVDEFQTQVQKLKQVSHPHIVFDTPVSDPVLNGHSAPLGLSLAPPTAPVRKLTPTAPNPIALAAVAAAAAHNKKTISNKCSRQFSSSDGGSMSSDFGDDDNHSTHTMENSSGASTPKIMNNEKIKEERLYRISVEEGNHF